MKHAFIAPTNYLHLIPQECDFHLLLAHLLKDKKYCEYYKEKQDRGDFIIIDNSAFEFKRAIDANEYFELVSQSGLTPNIVVASDYPGKSWETTLAGSIKFSNEYGKYFDPNKTKLMVVPQSIKGDYKGWIKGYQELIKLPNVEFVGMSILGIPNAFCSLTKTDDIATNRIFATAYLKANGLIDSHVKHHYLGLGSSIRELQIQKQLGVAYSNDSSSAMWRAIAHPDTDKKCYDDSATGMIDGKLEIPVDFDLKFDPNVTEYIKFNVNYVQQLLSV